MWANPLKIIPPLILYLSKTYPPKNNPSSNRPLKVRNYSRADQIRFRAVCKSWQQLPIDHVDNAEINTLPWVVTGDWIDSLAEEEEEEYCINNNDTSSEMSSCVLNCKLFDPKHPIPYSVNKILFKDRRTRVCSSNHGWLFFEKETNNDNLTSLYFLFSPFTQQIIHLPDLDHFIPGLKSTSPSHYTISHATFSSSDPYNDPDCEFFVIRDCFYRDCNYGACYRIAVSTCRRRDQNWTTRVFDKMNIQANWAEPIQQMLYSAQLGYLCCFTDFNAFVAYSVTRKDWIQLGNPQMRLSNGMFYGRPMLIECEGGLLVVLVRYGYADDSCRLFKFSWSSSNWKIKSSLPNEAIFIGPTSFLVPASGDIANKIYYYGFASENLKFYCLKDRQSHKYLRAAADDSLHRGWLAKRMLKLGVVWIQSP